MRGGNRFRFETVLGAIILIALLGACARGPGGGEPDPLLNWADVIEDANLADSIYAIGFAVPGAAACLQVDFCPEEVPEDVFFLVGTGFVAHYSNTIWTNAHVALEVQHLWELAVAEENPPFLPVPLAVKAGTVIGDAHTHKLNVDALRIHPQYDEAASSSPDIAVFLVDDASFQAVPSFLPRSFATKLRVGQHVGTLGFPRALSSPFQAVPIATFKEGTISALRPYSSQETRVTPENSKVVQFNLGQTGGTSGSPVFDHQGFIVAVSFSGIGAPGVDELSVPPVTPIGSLDFGIRVDEVWTLIDLIEADAAPTPAGSRIYPYPTYRAYPQNWNRKTLSAPVNRQ